MRIHERLDRLLHSTFGRPYQLHYRTYGQGERPLVLLHGLASSHAVWRPLIRMIRKDWQVIAPDLLGFGQSPAPEWNEYTVQQHARHVLALLRRFRINEPVTIVGHSMGCLVATHIAYKHPEMVEKLVLYEPPLFADMPDYRAHAKARSRYFSMFNYIASHPELAFKNGELRRILARISGISLRPETWVPFQRSLRNTIMQQSSYDELHALTVPTVIVHGRLDFVVPRADVRKMLQANPCISFRTVNRVHGISGRAGKEIAQILAAS